jgi:hypothetical protein
VMVWWDGSWQALPQSILLCCCGSGSVGRKHKANGDGNRNALRFKAKDQRRSSATNGTSTDVMMAMMKIGVVENVRKMETPVRSDHRQTSAPKPFQEATWKCAPVSSFCRQCNRFVCDKKEVESFCL